MPVLLALLAFSLQACQEDQFAEGGRRLILDGGLQGFESVTRAGEEDLGIANGAKLYLDFDGQKTFASYNSATQQWKLNALPIGDSGGVRAAIFLTSSQSGGAIAMYGEGSYTNSETATTVTASIKPVTARLRFRGTAGALVKVSGLTYYTSISTTNLTFTTSTNSINLAVGNDGYTPYVYVLFAGEPTMTITYDGRSFTKQYATDILQPGRSGCINLDTGEADFSGTYYIRNVATGLFLEAGNSWGTQASLGHGMDVFVESLGDGLYRLDTQVLNGDSKHYLGSNDGGASFYVDMDSDNSLFTLEQQGSGYLIRHTSGVVLTAQAGSTAVGSSDGNDDYSLWQLLTGADMLAEMQKATSTSPKDATWLIKDAGFSRNNNRFYSAWAEIDLPWKNGVNSSGWGDNNAQFWGYDVGIATTQQTIYVPNGVYELTCQGFYRYNDTGENTNAVAVSSHEDGTEEIHSYLFANGSMSPLCSVASEDLSFMTDWSGSVDYGLPFNQESAADAFVRGYYANNRVRVRVTDGVLRVGVSKLFHPGCDWTVFDNFELKYYGSSASYKAVSSVSVTGTTSLTVGTPVQLKATVLPSDASNTAVRWESSDRSVVRVSNTGKLTPIANGTAYITASALDGSGCQHSKLVTVGGGA